MTDLFPVSEFHDQTEYQKFMLFLDIKFPESLDFV